MHPSGSRQSGWFCLDRRGQVIEVPLDQLLTAKFAQCSGQRVGHGERTAHSKFGLDKKIGECVFGGRWHGFRPVQYTSSMRQRGQAVLRKRDPLEFHIRGMFVDALLINTGTCTVFQCWRVLVSQERKFVEYSTGQFAQMHEVGLQMPLEGCREIKFEQAAEHRVGSVEIDPVPVRNRMSVHHTMPRRSN